MHASRARRVLGRKTPEPQGLRKSVSVGSTERSIFIVLAFVRRCDAGVDEQNLIWIC
jgi:hypothetical protein